MDTDRTTGQLALIATCTLGLLVAAFATPVTAPSAELDIGDDSEPACTMSLSERPVPGQPVTVQIQYEERPVTDAPVWFNGEFVDRTDGNGRATGTVPYERRLNVQVRLPSGGQCRAGAGTGGEVTQSEATVGRFQAAGLAVAGDDSRPQQDSANGTGEYVVRGSIDIAVDRQPYPGEEATIRATIVDNPVPDATVTIDGEEVGRTDSNGQYVLTAPEEGDETLSVRVQRGEFESVKEITVLRLDATIAPNDPVALPGQDAVLDARLGDRPASNATVTMGGTQVGTTNESGAYGFELPADPTATMTVSTTEQQTVVPVWPVYVPIVVLVLAFTGVTAGIPVAGYAHSGRSGFVRAVLLVFNVYVLAISYSAGGGQGLLAAVGLIVTAAALVAIVRYDYPVRESLVATGRGTRDFSVHIVSAALWLTGRLESGLDAVGAYFRSLRAWLADVRTWSRADARRWLTALPGRLVGLLTTFVATPGRLLGRRSGDGNEADAKPVDQSDHDAARARSRRVRFRALWRQFASEVVPSRWHHRTAGEIRRRAIEQGLPDDPVTELTAVFRAVEYGTEPLSEAQIERAREAFASITTSDDEGGEGS